jgi:hypothetical protein
MEVIIRIALMFFFIQFLVVITIMSIALLLARPRDPVWDCEPGHEAFRRSFAFVIHLPSRVLRSTMRLMHSMRLRIVH